jgi:hypothetical protein
LPATPVKNKIIRASEKKKEVCFIKEKIDTGRSDESMSIGFTNADANEAEGSFFAVVNPTHGCGAS